MNDESFHYIEATIEREKTTLHLQKQKGLQKKPIDKVNIRSHEMLYRHSLHQMTMYVIQNRAVPEQFQPFKPEGKIAWKSSRIRLTIKALSRLQSS
jgi:arginyl-tRNA--protein-N-Asp/Glu arginylyltransferase